MLKQNPYGMRDVKKLKGFENRYRLRVGGVRIIYTIAANHDVEIIDIDYRGNIY